MLKFIISNLILLLSLPLFGNEEIQRPTNFPDKVLLKIKTESFTHRLYFVLRNGRIWMKPNYETTKIKSDWELVPIMGLPGSSKKMKPYKQVKKIVEIHSDGNNLIALDQDKTIYYTKIYPLIGFEDVQKKMPTNWISNFENYFNGSKKRVVGGGEFWREKWGLIFFAKKFQILKNNRAWGISHKGPLMEGYQDIDGVSQYISFGVTTLYALTPSGNEIQYIDPWLPPHWGNNAHKIKTPLDGRFVAKSMSTSGSTVFLIGSTGEMWTRLYDFDTAGHDPLLQYTYKREKKRIRERGEIATLPAEKWRKQPRISSGEITDNITLFQNGDKGNKGFTLRVEGKKNGKSGIFHKKIYSDKWSFSPIGQKITKSFLKRGKTPLGPKITKNYNGTINRKGIDLNAKLLNFNHHTNSGIIELKVKNKIFNINLYTVRNSVDKKGRQHAHGTIILPKQIMNSKDSEIKNIYKTVFHNERIIDFVIKEKENGTLKFKEDLHIFGVDEVVDVFYRTLYSKHFEEVKRKYKEAYGIRSLKIRKSENPNKLRRRIDMIFKPF
jgi:hypothetical protein